MIHFTLDGCEVDLIPFIKGLKSEKKHVIDALNNNTYDATAVALGFEDVEAIKIRHRIPGDFQASDLDEIYSYYLMKMGEVDMPDPTCTCLIDMCVERKIPINPLDMNDEMYTKLYCDTVSTLEFLKEKRVINKAMKAKFDLTSPTVFVKQWDSLINEIKGYKKMSYYREAYMTDQVRALAKYRKNILVAIEYERVKGVLDMLEIPNDL